MSYKTLKQYLNKDLVNIIIDYNEKPIQHDKFLQCLKFKDVRWVLNSSFSRPNDIDYEEHVNPVLNAA